MQNELGKNTVARRAPDATPPTPQVHGADRRPVAFPVSSRLPSPYPPPSTTIPHRGPHTQRGAAADPMLRATLGPAVAVAAKSPTSGAPSGMDICISGTRAHPSRSCQIAGLTYLAVHAPHGAGPLRVIRAQSSRLRARMSREGSPSPSPLLSGAGPTKMGCAAVEYVRVVPRLVAVSREADGLRVPQARCPRTARRWRGRSGDLCQPSFPCQPSRDTFSCW